MEQQLQPTGFETVVPEDVEYHTLEIGPTIRFLLPGRWQARFSFDTGPLADLLEQRAGQLAAMDAVLSHVESQDRDLKPGEVRKLEATRDRIVDLTADIDRQGAGLATLTLDFRLHRGTDRESLATVSRYVLDRLDAAGPTGGRLDLETVRRFRFQDWIRRLLPGVLGRGAGTAEALAGMFSENSDGLDRVAMTYRLAELLGQPPTTAVAKDLHISTAAAAQRVRRARIAGLLPPATTGKAR